MNEFTKNRVRGFLLDVTGVLYNGSEDGCGTVIPGSVEAVERFLVFIITLLSLKRWKEES